MGMNAFLRQVCFVGESFAGFILNECSPMSDVRLEKPKPVGALPNGAVHYYLCALCEMVKLQVQIVNPEIAQTMAGGNVCDGSMEPEPGVKHPRADAEQQHAADGDGRVVEVGLGDGVYATGREKRTVRRATQAMATQPTTRLQRRPRWNGPGTKNSRAVVTRKRMGSA